MKACLTAIPLTALAATLAVACYGDEFEFVPAYDKHSTLRPNAIQQGLPEGFEDEALVAGVDDLNVDQGLRGFFVFGDDNSRSIVLAAIGNPPTRLWIDLNRDRKLTDKEEVAPTKQTGQWICTIPAEYVIGPNEFEHQSTATMIQWDPGSESFQIQTRGTMNGRIPHPSDANVPLVDARYVDANNNGNWFDRQDRFLVDLNQDGQLDPILERFVCQSNCRVGDSQFLVAGDASGRRLRLLEVREMGQVIPNIRLVIPDAELVALDASLASESGFRVNIDSLGKPLDCPIGTYRVAELDLKLKHEDKLYVFHFRRLGQAKAQYDVSLNGTLELDLLGDLELGAVRSIVRDGDQARLSVTPMLSSESGLYLASSRAGGIAQNENRLTTRSLFGSEIFHVGSSGFS